MTYRTCSHTVVCAKETQTKPNSLKLKVVSANKKSFIGFIKKHKILSTVAAILLFDILVVVVGYFSLGWFTNHDSNLTVPDLHGLPVEEAAEILHRNNMQMEISDSTYLETVSPGCVNEQTPKAGSTVKEGRLIYVTIRAFSTKLMKMPELRDMSLRQGESLLRSAGFKNIKTQTIPSEYQDLIYDVKWNGSSLYKNDKVPVSATITIVVGDGSLSNVQEEGMDNSSDGDVPANEDEFPEYLY